ncbi:hypothetical protein BGW36DRAFT_432962 [Talaromyces proteolyticus]|uniref:Uncharacterized protein n=1 Tax=Talaromyces proteolyticus TaxID=1131652 RepID=A0AAD4KEV4_9EURO|nr:uncharacterized protein BGW36DRAFT_432962 [Talaromyces proteolyticus]KAH8689999.1 hypothetical protein BGW36DRAFT_432962 [Talaromyces proteolyticus]
MTFHPNCLPDLTGKVYIVTGGTSGIGYHTVYNLAKHGAHVYICARNRDKGSAVISEIKAKAPGVYISLLEIDHLSISSVVSAAKQFISKESLLHGLINNAGIMATPFEMTPDGFEAQWQTNYLAHWVFTYYLLPLLLKTSKICRPGTVRIVNLASSGHFSAPKGGIDFDDTSLQNETGMTRYGQSKLANVLHIKTLNKLYGPASPSSSAGNGEVWVSAVHPGLVDSNLGIRAVEIPKLMKIIISLYGALGGRTDADKGSWTSVFCAASPMMKQEQSGEYFQRIAEPGWQSKLAKDLNLAEKLEEWTYQKMEGGGWL